MIQKICISGPAISGKTYFIKQIDNLMPYSIIINESARNVAEMYPDLPEKDIYKFSDQIYDIQKNREVITENLIGNGIIVCDRGIFDNLAFLLLRDKVRFNKELSLVKKLYENKIIKKYDYILYFDIDLTGGTTDILKKALKDPLRKSTINIDNYAGHVTDFRNAFFETINHFDDISIIPAIARPDEKGFDKRNMFAKDYIDSLYDCTCLTDVEMKNQFNRLKLEATEL